MRPRESLAFQALLPQAKSVAMPVQRFDLVVMAVGEDVQRAGKGAQSEFLLDQDAQAVDGFSEIDGFAVQVDRKRSSNHSRSMRRFTH